jgi:hypothetical protein
MKLLCATATAIVDRAVRSGQISRVQTEDYHLGCDVDDCPGGDIGIALSQD